MARALPNPDALSERTDQHVHHADFSEDRTFHAGRNGNGTPHLSGTDLWNADNQSVDLGGQPTDDHHDLLATLGLVREEANDAQPDPEFERLLRENQELREIIAELKQQLDQAPPGPDPSILDRQKEFEALLEEKTEIIRNLHLKIQEQENHRPASGSVPREDELLALSEELDRERCQLQQERRQLEEERKQLVDDEQLMTKQMRDMEVQMARERADFARQRSELTRVYEEIRREMENIERNGLLNQRLGQLRQRFQETGVTAASSTPPRSGSGPSIPAARPETQPAEDPKDVSASKRRESFLGRIFG